MRLDVFSQSGDLIMTFNRKQVVHGKDESIRVQKEDFVRPTFNILRTHKALENVVFCFRLDGGGIHTEDAINYIYLL